MPVITIGKLDAFEGNDLGDLCDATETAILAGGGFGWLRPPPRDVLERYWRGVVLVPERMLFVGRLDGVIAGSVQLVRPPRNNEAQAFAVTLTTDFVAPWARGHGMARGLTVEAEEAARAAGFRFIFLDVRETQTAAIGLYESLGYERWGVNPNYAMVDRKMVAGYFYSKRLRPARKSSATRGKELDS